MSAIARWLRGWRVALRIARREAWRGGPARRRSVLVATLVGLPVLAASGTLSLALAFSSTSPHGMTRADLLAQIPDGAQASLSPSFPGQAVSQDPYGNVPWTDSLASADAEDRAEQLAENLAALEKELPAGDHLVLRREGTLVAFASTGTDRYSILARTAAGYSDGRATPDLLALTGAGTLRAGRAPSVDQEVVVNPRLAALAGVSPGSTLWLATRADTTAGRTAVVVSGIADLPTIDQPALVGSPGGLPGGLPGELPGARSTPGMNQLISSSPGSLLVVGPEPVTWATVPAINRIGWTALSRDVISKAPEPTRDDQPPDLGSGWSSDRAEALLGAEVAGLVLLQLVLLAAPAMAVGARRREHMLALTAVTGADRAAVRRVVLALAVLMGAPGAVLGALAGAGSALTVLFLAGELRAWRQLDVLWAGVAGLAALGVLVAVLAALVPALTSARLDPVAVLRGRRRDARPRRRTPWIGLALVVLGTAGTFAAASRTGLLPVPQAAFTVLGIAVAEIGFILCLPAVIALAARAADHGPLFLRLALRDADRHRLRTVPAVAAATAAIAGSIAAQMFFTAQDNTWGFTLSRVVPARAMVLTLDGAMPLAPADADRWRNQTLRTMAGAGVGDLVPIWTMGPTSITSNGISSQPWPGAEETSLNEVEAGLVPPPTACTAPETPDHAGAVPASLCDATGEYLHGPGRTFGIAVGDGRLIRTLLGRELPEATRALAAGRAVVSDPRLVWPDGTVHVRLWRWDDPPRIVQEFALPAAAVDSPVLFDGVLPADAVQRVAPQAYDRLRATVMIAETTRAVSWFGLSQELRDQLSTLAPAAYPDVRDRGPELRQLAMLAFAALVTLFGAASAVALAAAEGRADAATLAAVGASPRTRRRLAAMQALMIAGLGGVGGVVSGLLAGWALVQVGATSQATVPWVDVVGLGVVLPLALAAAAYLFTRSRLTLVRRPE